MRKLKIIYEDKDIIVINKPSGILTINNGKQTINLYHEVREYIKKQNPNNKVFIVHRLDKDTSGVIIFAKSESVKHSLQGSWENTSREYYAVVEGCPKKKKDRLEYYLKENKTFQVYVTNDMKNGKLAITNYEVEKTNSKYSLLKLHIETGRKNQIRASLSHLGHPIIGDKKYQAKSNSLKRLGLHAKKLTIIHPKTKKEMTFTAEIPKTFFKVVE